MFHPFCDNLDRARSQQEHDCQSTCLLTMDRLQGIFSYLVWIVHKKIYSASIWHVFYRYQKKLFDFIYLAHYTWAFDLITHHWSGLGLEKDSYIVFLPFHEPYSLSETKDIKKNVMQFFIACFHIYHLITEYNKWVESRSSLFYFLSYKFPSIQVCI